MFPEILTFSLAVYINQFVDFLVVNCGDQFEAFSDTLLTRLLAFEHVLRASPWWVTIGFIAILGYFSSKSVKRAMFLSLAMLFVGSLGLWDKAMQSLALMLVSIGLCIVIGIPLGILTSKSQRIRNTLLPVMDVMQTMPSFVYLIPALMLFGLGKVPSIFATMIYALPPLIRLTDLGIRLVDKEVMEAATAFGVSKREKLCSIQLPLALPNIMAGINQSTMMALSMVVIASMIGARGLGEQVLLGIQRMDVGAGMEAGLAIVAIAIVLDRITQSFGHRLDHQNQPENV